MQVSTGYSSACRTSGMNGRRGRLAATRGCRSWFRPIRTSSTRWRPAVRRDAFCGKFSIMDVFCPVRTDVHGLEAAYGFPGSPRSRATGLFRPALPRGGGLGAMTVGSIGARTTAFKTVRIDELALQQHGITMETFDLSDVFARWGRLAKRSARMAKAAGAQAVYRLLGKASRRGRSTSSPAGRGAGRLVEEYGLDCLAVRCWVEMQQQLRISPCVLLSRDERPRHASGLRGGCGQRGRDARPAMAIGRGRRVPGLEQQLRRRRGQVHPLPLRAGAAGDDDRRAR